MENKLKMLFEYQRFEQSSPLAKLIEETESKYAAELSDDDLDMVFAAGEAELNIQNPFDEEENN